jgi:hypothetical protein
MGKRLAILIGAAALGAAVIAAGASADFRSVDDPRGDAKCFQESSGPDRPCSGFIRNADIIRATAGHEGRWLKHTIRVVGRVRHVQFYIDTDSELPGCEFRLYIPGSKVRECGGGYTPTGRARVDFHRHSVEISFSKRSIGFPRFYGWSATVTAGTWPPHAVDHVPSEGIRHWLR